MTVDLFDASAMYDDDYLHFFAGPPAKVTHGPAVPTDHGGSPTADRLWRLLDLEPGMSVLDVGCGHGSLANALAGRGCQVTGLDFSTVFLERARSDATAQGVDVDYRAGDMRELPREWTGRFDRLVNWSTAFGYFDDPTNRRVLAEMARVLRPGGRLAMDLDNQIRFLTSWTPSRVTVAKENGDMLVDRHRLDALTGRFEVERTVIRDGTVRTLTFLKRLFGFPELRDWCVAAGFGEVSAYGEDERPLTAEHHRMVIRAVK
ncbi:class I SAM-dependent methyltransferase [Actinoplanes siamensis]|uniref:class I SAM-dependent methyltransferase n=1 Tax=Actinoplanes siamensis TaxID=1223317 RepID=UPI001940F5B7|nr:class I SAM-dependent methyltransferase [Actinoplanes siamensis]